MRNDNDFDFGVRKLVNVAFGIMDKPPLGSPPPHLLEIVKSVGGLSNLASRVGLWILRMSEEETGYRKAFRGQQMATVLGLTANELNDAVDELESGGLVRAIRHMHTGEFDFDDVEATYVLFIRFKSYLVSPYDPESDAKAVTAAVAGAEANGGRRIAINYGYSNFATQSSGGVPGRLRSAPSVKAHAHGSV